MVVFTSKFEGLVFEARDSGITPLKVHGPCKTRDKSKQEDEGDRARKSDMKYVSVENTSGTEVYKTIFLILRVKIMLCSKLHCINFFELKLLFL